MTTRFSNEELTRILLMTIAARGLPDDADNFAEAVGRMALNYAVLRHSLAKGAAWTGPDGSRTRVTLDGEGLTLDHSFPLAE